MSEGSSGLTIATYNVNGVNGRLPRLLEWLAETSPDIVCLQELKTDDTKFPASALERAGYGAVWHGQRAHHGVAILAKGDTPRELKRGLGRVSSSSGKKRLMAASVQPRSLSSGTLNRRLRSTRGLIYLIYVQLVILSTQMPSLLIACRQHHIQTLS